jgi:hypothetical protein
LFFAIAGGGFAAASLIGSGGVIHGCVSKSTGMLIIVKAGHKCKASQSAISFDQRGRQGVTGRAGVTGPRGTTGSAGEAIVLRARGTTPLVLTNMPTPFAVSPDSWHQAANEVDTLVGSVNVTEPAASDCMPGGVTDGTLQGRLIVNGAAIAFISDLATGSSPQTANLLVNATRFEPGGSGSSNTITLLFSDDCPGTAHFEVNSVAMDVEGAQ